QDRSAAHPLPRGRRCRVRLRRAESRWDVSRKSVPEWRGCRVSGAIKARFCKRTPSEAGIEPAGFLRALRAGDGVSGGAEDAGLVWSSLRAKRSNPALCARLWIASFASLLAMTRR